MNGKASQLHVRGLRRILRKYNVEATAIRIRDCDGSNDSIVHVYYQRIDSAGSWFGDAIYSTVAFRPRILSFVIITQKHNSGLRTW